MTRTGRQPGLPSWYVNDSGRVLGSRAFWALVDTYRESGTTMTLVHDGPGLSGARIDPDGTWWRPEGMTTEELAELKDRHRREHAGQCGWTRHDVNRRVLANGTTELTLQGSRYATRPEQQGGAGPVIHAAEPCARAFVPTPDDGTVESSAAYAMAQEHCGAPYTAVWQGRGWTVEVSVTYPLWTVQG